MKSYQQLQRLAANDPEAVRLAGDGRNQRLVNATVKVLACRDGRVSLPSDKVSAILAASIEALKPLPELSDADLHLQNVERRRDSQRFLDAEEMFIRNRRPGLFESIQGAAIGQGLREMDLTWLRCAVAVVSRAARLARRQARRNRTAPPRRTRAT